ncbi:YgiW/YdeI family stress tolerance OB fold protein [Nitrospira sp. T9]|uniref:YgiW/YdeI family stress tolerance OB fold protein n=1 Tax=unclassified Nitrospira TaxID=2652172 RepID=UPI003F96C420
MSRNILFMTIGLFIFSTLTLWAQFHDPRHTGITTVSAAQGAVDDSRVSLTGTILRQLGEERYLFQDATGTIIVEIDHEDWRNVPVNPETIVRISGEVDRDWLATGIDVERVEVMTASSQGSNQLQRNDSDQTNPTDGGQTSCRSQSLSQLC